MPTPGNGLNISTKGIVYFDGVNVFSAISNGVLGQALVAQGPSSPAQFETLPVSGGGTAAITFIPAYGVICAGTTPQGALQDAGTGTTNQVYTSNGSAALGSFQTLSIIPISITAVSTSPYVVLNTDYYLSVNTGSARTINLPNAPSTGRGFVIKDTSGTANTNNITVTTVGGVVTIDGSTSYVINQSYGAINLIFNGTSYEVY